MYIVCLLYALKEKLKQKSEIWNHAVDEILATQLQAKLVKITSIQQNEAIPPRRPLFSHYQMNDVENCCQYAQVCDAIYKCFNRPSFSAHLGDFLRNAPSKYPAKARENDQQNLILFPSKN